MAWKIRQIILNIWTCPMVTFDKLLKQFIYNCTGWTVDTMIQNYYLSYMQLWIVWCNILVTYSQVLPARHSPFPLQSSGQRRAEMAAKGSFGRVPFGMFSSSLFLHSICVEAEYTSATDRSSMNWNRFRAKLSTNYLSRSYWWQS